MHSLVELNFFIVVEQSGDFKWLFLFRFEGMLIKLSKELEKISSILLTDFVWAKIAKGVVGQARQLKGVVRVSLDNCVQLKCTGLVMIN